MARIHQTHKIPEYPITPKQKSWLLKMCNHKHKHYWLSEVKREEEQIRKILIKESYDNKEQRFLNEIVDYYTEHIGFRGTLNNPK